MHINPHRLMTQTPTKYRGTRRGYRRKTRRTTCTPKKVRGHQVRRTRNDFEGGEGAILNTWTSFFSHFFPISFSFPSGRSFIYPG